MYIVENIKYSFYLPLTTAKNATLYNAMFDAEKKIPLINKV